MLRRSFCVAPPTSLLTRCSNLQSKSSNNFVMRPTLITSRAPCAAFASSIADVFTATGQQSVAATKSSHATSLQAELNKLVKARLEIDKACEKKPDLYAMLALGYLVVQTATLYYWVHTRFDWCLCEPITYLLGTAVAWIGLGFYLMTGGDFDYDVLRNLMIERARKKAYASAKLDVARIGVLERELALIELELKNASSNGAE